MRLKGFFCGERPRGVGDADFDGHRSSLVPGQLVIEFDGPDAGGGHQGLWEGKARQRISGLRLRVCLAPLPTRFPIYRRKRIPWALDSDLSR